MTGFLQLKAQWQAGYSAARARDKKDESLAQFQHNWSNKAMNISSDRRAEQEAFDKGYRMYNDGYLISDCPYS